MNMEGMDISVVVPLFNEEESLPELTDWIRRVMEERGFSYEILLVDDGSKDGSWAVIRELAAANEHIRGIRFRRNYGKSAALNTGFQASRGEVVITMDADLQDSPSCTGSLRRSVTISYRAGRKSGTTPSRRPCLPSFSMP